MMAFLIHSSMSPNFSKELEIKREENSYQNQVIFFDILVCLNLTSYSFFSNAYMFATINYADQ